MPSISAIMKLKLIERMKVIELIESLLTLIERMENLSKMVHNLLECSN